jgi:hypothetical protein
MQTIEIAPGNFQDVSWAGVTMRIEYTAQYRKEPGDSAAQLRIAATRGILPGKLQINAGALADDMEHDLYRLPGGPPETAGARCVYYHYMSGGSYCVFVLYVDHINPQNGLLKLDGLFAAWAPPIDWSILGKIAPNG